MEPELETEYKEVLQSWIDNYDLTKAKNGENPIVFYDDEKNIVTDFNKHKTQYIENIGDHGHTDTITKNGLKLLVKNSDHKALQKYLNDEMAKKTEEAEKKEKNIINNNKLILNSIKQKLIEGVNQSTLTDNYKKKFIACIERAAIVCEQHLKNDSANKKTLSERFSFYINENLKDDLIFKSSDEHKNKDILNENINFTLVTNDDNTYRTNLRKDINSAHKIKIKVPHIIFVYNFNSEQIITLRTIKINDDYLYGYDVNHVASINATPPISANSKSEVFYIYKAELNPEIATELNPPLPSGVSRIGYYLQCFKGLCTRKKNHADDIKTPNGGKRTRKNKKTRKQNKKVFRKIKNFRKR